MCGSSKVAERWALKQLGISAPSASYTATIVRQWGSATVIMIECERGRFFVKECARHFDTEVVRTVAASRYFPSHTARVDATDISRRLVLLEGVEAESLKAAGTPAR